MSKQSNLFLGHAGQLAVMSELLSRGWNVAVPQVDIGDDVLVIDDEDGSFYRIQVKTASASHRKSSYGLRFRLPLQQLSQPRSADLTYILVGRFNEQWDLFLIIPRPELYRLYLQHKIGSTIDNSVVLYVRCENDQVTCSGQHLTRFRANWNRF